MELNLHCPGDPAFWHDGERALQALAGVREMMEERGKVRLRDHMPDQHRLFFAERSQMFLATLDRSGQPWATLVEGDIGFMTSPSPRRLAISAVPAADDPAAAGIVDGAPIGALGLEFETRRRNRVNGRVRLAPDIGGFAIEVDQSFGNCPQYIQARRPSELCEAPGATGTPRRAGSLSAGDAELIRRADTFFIASRSSTPGLARSEGLDISHRGGLPGFVLIDDDRHLRFPDYRGNSYFNTLGNLRVDPRCALLFIDFSNGTTLQITGRGKVMTEPDACRPWAGAERAVAIAVDTVVLTERRSRFRFEFVSLAPQLQARAPQLPV
jgi:uncharacterized protein